MQREDTSLDLCECVCLKSTLRNTLDGMPMRRCSVIESAISSALLLSYQPVPAVSLALISIEKDLHEM